MEAQNAAQGATPTPPAVINTTEILAQMKGGKTRDEINKELGLNAAERKALWNHPDLKKKKTLRGDKAVRFNFADGSVPVVPAPKAKTAAAQPLSTDVPAGQAEVAPATEQSAAEQAVAPATPEAGEANANTANASGWGQ